MHGKYILRWQLHSYIQCTWLLVLTIWDLGSLPKKDWTRNSYCLFEVPSYIFAPRFGAVETKKKTIIVAKWAKQSTDAALSHLQDALELLIGEGSQQLWDQAPQGVGGDVAKALLVVHPVQWWFFTSTKTSILRNRFAQPTWMRPSAPSSWSPCPGPQPGRWHKAGKTLRTRSRQNHPRRSHGAGPSKFKVEKSLSVSVFLTFNSSSVGRKPMALMISPRSSAERKSCFFVSNRSKQTWNRVHSKPLINCHKFAFARTTSGLQQKAQTFRHLISSTASPVASVISSKSMSA